MMCGTPKGYGNWSYEMYLKGKQDDQNGKVFNILLFKVEWFQKKNLDQAKQDIDIRTFRQEFEGTFENYAGASIL
nr:MAG: hypothetical protein CM15mV140_260 [Caudoviricetes sp.]